MTTLLWVLVIGVIFDAAVGVQSASLHPVILVPRGLGGSRLDANISIMPKECWNVTIDKERMTWSPLWVNYAYLNSTDNEECLVALMRLEYDRDNGTTRNAPGVDIRQPGFGDTNTVEYASVTDHKDSAVLADLVEYLVENMNYTRGVSIRGAPYDFRKAPNEMADYVESLIHLVEETYEKNENTTVTLLGHGLGSVYILYALNQQPQTWKDTYINSFISLGAPWGGSVLSLKMLISGDSLYSDIPIPPHTMRKAHRSFPSIAFIMPYDNFWNDTDDDTLVITPNSSYTVADYERLFNDTGLDDVYAMRQNNEYFIKNLTAPGVTMHCMYGIGIPTLEALSYTVADNSTNSTGLWYDTDPLVDVGNGDGVVNERSLRGCRRWAKQQTQKVLLRSYGGINHIQIAKHPVVLKYIASVLG